MPITDLTTLIAAINSEITSNGTGAITGANLNSVLIGVTNVFAPLAAPALTGIPLAPTASPGTNTTQIATTAAIVAERTAAAVLTLKAITPRVQSVTSAATVTPDANNNDIVIVTAQAAAVTFANPTGSPVEGQTMVIRIKDNATARAITYGTQYRALGVTLPTTTVISKTLYIGMIFNTEDTTWDCVGVSQQA